MRSVLTLLLVIALAAAALLVVQSMVVWAQSDATRSEDIGLSKASVFDTPAPPATAVNASDPGDRPTVNPGFPEQPPVIPHGIDDFLPITADDNQCIDCHEVAEKEPGEPTPVPPSHYVDMRRSPGETGDEIVGARYLCTSCHVSPGDNLPLVGNTFSQ